jgi:hypothetical protein
MSMSPVLRELYQKRILELNARPLNFGPLPGHTHEGTAPQPALRRRGDAAPPSSTTAMMHRGSLRGSGLRALACLGLACSALAVRGARRSAQALALAGSSSLASSPAVTSRPRSIARRSASSSSLEGVREVPARLRCATLPWEALARCPRRLSDARGHGHVSAWPRETQPEIAFEFKDNSSRPRHLARVLLKRPGAGALPSGAALLAGSRAKGARASLVNAVQRRRTGEAMPSLRRLVGHGLARLRLAPRRLRGRGRSRARTPWARCTRP